MFCVVKRNISKTAPKEQHFGDHENQPYMQNMYPSVMPSSWGEISPKLPQEKNSLEIQRTSKMLNNLSQVDASQLGRNISETAPKEPQLGDPEKRPYIQKMYPREMPPSWREISPKLLPKNHSWRSRQEGKCITIYPREMPPSWGKNILHNCSKEP